MEQATFDVSQNQYTSKRRLFKENRLKKRSGSGWFKVQCAGSGWLRVQGSGLRVQGSECTVEGAGFRVQRFHSVAFDRSIVFRVTSYQLICTVRRRPFYRLHSFGFHC